MPPTIGLSTIVCGFETSILKNPASATRSVVKNVKLGTAKAMMPRAIRINPITANGFMFGLLFVVNNPLARTMAFAVACLPEGT